MQVQMSSCSDRASQPYLAEQTCFQAVRWVGMLSVLSHPLFTMMLGDHAQEQLSKILMAASAALPSLHY
jgi:hypothetical protein